MPVLPYSFSITAIRRPDPAARSLSRGRCREERVKMKSEDEVRKQKRKKTTILQGQPLSSFLMCAAGTGQAHRLRRVVLPAPRKPESRINGVLPAAMLSSKGGFSEIFVKMIPFKLARVKITVCDAYTSMQSVSLASCLEQ